MPAGQADALAEICREYEIDIMWSFGSRAAEIRDWLAGSIAELNDRTSDVDIGVKPAPGRRLTVAEKVGLAQALEELLQVSRVDLVVLPEADPFLAANVIRGELLYFRDKYVADEYELYVLRRAGDLAPLERERIDLILGRHR